MVAEKVRVNAYKHFGLGSRIDENINENGGYPLVYGEDDTGVHSIAFILPRINKGLVIFTNSDNGTGTFEQTVNHFLEKDARDIVTAEMN